MELSAIRTHVLEQMDWTPEQSTDFKAKINRFVNRAYQYLYEDAPFLLQANVTIQTKKDVTSVTAVAGDRVESMGADAYVMQRTAGVVGATPWVFDGSWDGRWVEIVDPTGVTRRVQTREWWNTGSPGFDRFSLVAPWASTPNVGMTYRVYTPTYHLHGDVVSIKNAQIYHGANYQLKVATQGEMESGRLVDYQGRTSGIPRVVFPGNPFALDAPTRAPSVRAAPGLLPTPWAGPDNAGQFDFCYTYCWGRRDSWEVSSEPRRACVGVGPFACVC